MGVKWAGFSAKGSNSVALVLLDQDATLQVCKDEEWPLQKGERHDAYGVMFKSIINYIEEYRIEEIVIRGSGRPQSSCGIGHLHAAELRGVIMAAAVSSSANVTVLDPSAVTRASKGKKDREAGENSSLQLLAPCPTKRGSELADLVIFAMERR